MRCTCPQCGAFMEHAETSASCVCPQCLNRCSACLGAGTVWSRDAIERLKTAPEEERRALESRLMPDGAGGALQDDSFSAPGWGLTEGPGED